MEDLVPSQLVLSVETSGHQSFRFFRIVWELGLGRFVVFDVLLLLLLLVGTIVDTLHRVEILFVLFSDFFGRLTTGIV